MIKLMIMIGHTKKINLKNHPNNKSYYNLKDKSTNTKINIYFLNLLIYLFI